MALAAGRAGSYPVAPLARPEVQAAMSEGASVVRHRVDNSASHVAACLVHQVSGCQALWFLFSGLFPRARPAWLLAESPGLLSSAARSAPELCDLPAPSAAFRRALLPFGVQRAAATTCRLEVLPRNPMARVAIVSHTHRTLPGAHNIAHRHSRAAALADPKAEQLRCSGRCNQVTQLWQPSE
jgi:hypothetical protein